MVVLIAGALLSVLVIAIRWVGPAIREWRRRRDVVRGSALNQQIQAMRATQQLSMMAWSARRAMRSVMAEEMRDGGASDETRVTRTLYK